MRSRTKTTTILTVLVALVGMVGGPAMAIEEPKFTRVEKSGDFEIRAYAPYLVAETLVSGEFDDAGNEGFRRLAGYIFGGNRGKRKIAMTAPVAQQASPQGEPKGEKIAMTAPVGQERRGDAWRVTFALPAEIGQADAPIPNDARVTLREVAARTVASLGFSGTWSPERFAEKKAELLRRCQAKGLKIRGEVQYARYDPPWTPWFLRRNEVMVEVGRE